MTLENHNPRNMRPGFQIRTVLLLLLALGVTWTARIESADANANRAPSAAGAKPHKIQVSDPFLATEMAARGARLLTDYGGYKLFEVDAVTPEMLNAHVAEIRDEYNLIMLNVGAIDTTTQGAKALRKSAGSFAGKRLHLVQLAGPVRPDWHRELLNTGVQIISYVPQNTYLIYSDATGLAQLQTLAATSSYIQWDGGYLDEY